MNQTTETNSTSNNFVDNEVYREEDEIEDNEDMDVEGYYAAIRSSPRPIQQQLAEWTSNSLEAIRLAEQKFGPGNESKIFISAYLDENDKPKKFVVEDIAKKGTGIKHLKSKNILKQYNHKGDKRGFSEYGEGGSEALKQMANLILYETSLNETSVSESLQLDKDVAIQNGNIKKSAEYSSSCSYVPQEGYKSGTRVSLTDIYEMYTTKELGNEFLDGTIASILSESFVRLNLNIKEFKLRVFNNENEIEVIFDIKQINNLKDKQRTHNLELYQHKVTKEKLCVTKKEDKLYTYEKRPSKKGDSCNKIELNTKDEVRKSIEPKSKKGSTKAKKTFDELYNEKYDIDNYDKLTPSDLILCLSTDKERDHDKMGFEGHRRVAGGNIIKSSGDPLNLKFGLFKSHRTRHSQFRGAINYDRDWDKYLNSDKSKTISDDRPFIPTIQYVIKGLTSEYISDMRSLYKDYIAEKEEDEETNNNQQLSATNVLSQESTNDQQNSDAVVNNVSEESTNDLQNSDVVVNNVSEESTNEQQESEEIVNDVSEESTNDQQVSHEIVNENQSEVIIENQNTVVNVVSEESTDHQEEAVAAVNNVLEESTDHQEEAVAVVNNVSEESNNHQEAIILVVSEESNDDQAESVTVTFDNLEVFADDQEGTNEIERIEPEIIHRRESLAEYANKDKIIRALDNLISRPQYHEVLDNALENQFKVHRLIDLDVFHDIYSKLTIQQKVEIYKKKLNIKYLFDTDLVDEGSVFLREYNACINLPN